MKKKLIWFMLMVLLTASMAGCQSKVPQKLTIGVMADTGAIPFVMAKEQGIFEKHGLDVEVQVFRSALDRDAALQTGALDGAMADMLTIFFYDKSGFDVKMTSQTYGDYIMVSAPDMSKEEFLNTDDIQIGLSSNTVIEFATEQIASQLGFDSKLNKVAIPQMPVRLQLLDSGELTGATLPDPLAAAANLKGSRIGSTSEMDLFPGIFIMNGSVLDEKSEAAEKMYLAYNEAVEYLNGTDMSEYFDVLEAQLGFPAALKDTYVMPEFRSAQAPDKVTFDTAQQWMLDRSLIDEAVNYEDVSHLDYVK